METLVFILIGVVVGGALGARVQGFDAWKGAIAAMCGAALVIVLGVFFAIDNWLLDILIFMVGVGVLGGAIKLPGRALSSIVLGAALFGVAVAGLGGAL